MKLPQTEQDAILTADADNGEPLDAARKISARSEARVGPFMAIPRVLEEAGVLPELAFQQAGMTPGQLDNPENRISHEAIAHLLCVCADLSGRADFGVLLGEHFKLTDFGTIGELMRSAATTGEALQVLAFHFRLHDQAGIPLVNRLDGSRAFLGYSLQYPAIPGTHHIYDLSITIAKNILRELCGPAWQSESVQLSHSLLGEVSRYRRVLGSHLRFDAELSGIIFPVLWLNHPLTSANPARFVVLNQALLDAESRRTPACFADEVRWIVHQQLMSGICSATDVARLLSVSERTLRHKLKTEGTNMQQIFAEIRFDQARHLLQNTNLPMSEIAAVLCYSDAAVFSRAFRQNVGTSPRDWRVMNKG